MLDYVLSQLYERRGTWQTISTETGVPYHTLSKISSGAIKDPGVRKIEILDDYFKKNEERYKEAIK